MNSNIHYFEPWPEPPPADSEPLGRLAMAATMEVVAVETQINWKLGHPATLGDLVELSINPSAILSGIDTAALPRALAALGDLEAAGARSVRDMRPGSAGDFIPVADLRAQIEVVEKRLVPILKFSKRNKGATS